MKHLISRIVVSVCLALAASTGLAQDNVTLGSGRIFNNDLFGDGSDRWRTTSYTYSLLRGAPDAVAGGQVLEYRLMGEMISSDGRQNDRPYVGALTAGVAMHEIADGWHRVLGADLVAIGPQTGLASLQDRFHDRFDIPRPFLDNQVPNTVRVRGRAEIAKAVRVSPTVTVRPFAGAEIGVENRAMIGADVLMGQVAQSDILLRDVVTGQLYRGTQNGPNGFSFLAGADAAWVGESAYLPAAQGPGPTEERYRLRMGVHWQPRENVSYFYGVTYLSEEFEGQSEGQVVGSLTLGFRF